MWYLLAGTGASTIVFALLYFRARKILGEAREKLGELSEKLVEKDRRIVEIERGRADDRELQSRINIASSRHIYSCQAQLKSETLAADERGDDTAVLRSLNSRMERLRELSEATADRRDQDGELFRRDRAATTPAKIAGG